MTFESKIEFLRNLGCDEINHTNQTLLEHLIGVYKLLKSWNAPEYIQDAGLFHSVYGTSYFKPVILIDREVVKNIIGIHAEALVFIFCFLPHPRAQEISNIKNEQVKQDLLLIYRANAEDMDLNRMMTWEQAYNV